MIFKPSQKLSNEAIAFWTPMVKKPSTVFMSKVDEDFDVVTNEGILSAHAGDYVAHDPGSGHFWPVAASYVEMHYVELPV